MPGNPREIVTMAERRFPVRIRIGVPPSGFGQRYTEITEWLDGNCGKEAWRWARDFLLPPLPDHPHEDREYTPAHISTT
jgi:hypothetical protein